MIDEDDIADHVEEAEEEKEHDNYDADDIKPIDGESDNKAGELMVDDDEEEELTEDESRFNKPKTVRKKKMTEWEQRNKKIRLRGTLRKV